jgi:hypothetical protein
MSTPAAGNPGIIPNAGMAVDLSQIVSELSSVKAARDLPVGSIVGDLHGGLTFTDAIAAALESRSTTGWREVRTSDCETWTIIILDH